MSANHNVVDIGEDYRELFKECQNADPRGSSQPLIIRVYHAFSYNKVHCFRLLGTI